jgi:hypothetical protein
VGEGGWTVHCTHGGSSAVHLALHARHPARLWRCVRSRDIYGHVCQRANTRGGSSAHKQLSVKFRMQASVSVQLHQITQLVVYTVLCSEKRPCAHLACSRHCPLSAGDSNMRRKSAAGTLWLPTPSPPDAPGASMNTQLSCVARSCVSVNVTQPSS